MPELRRLRAFVAVAEELNFTRAAERLHLASRPFEVGAPLEAELGVELLERTTRAVRLTAAGAALLEHGPGRARRGRRGVRLRPCRGARVLGHACAWARRRPSATRSSRAWSRRCATARPTSPSRCCEVRPGDVERLLRDREVDLVLARTARTGPEVASAALPPTPARAAVPADHPLAGAGDARARTARRRAPAPGAPAARPTRTCWWRASRRRARASSPSSRASRAARRSSSCGARRRRRGARGLAGGRRDGPPGAPRRPHAAARRAVGRGPRAAGRAAAARGAVTGVRRSAPRRREAAPLVIRAALCRR